MRVVYRGARVYTRGVFRESDIVIEDGILAAMGENIPVTASESVVSIKNQYVVPGFCDVHVHLREPGFSQKESIRTGTAAAYRAGYAAVCAMPNLDPPPDTLAHLQVQLELIRRDAQVSVCPVGCLTMGRRGESPADLRELAPYVAAFSDDGAGVMDDGVMRACMEAVADCGGLVAAHTEDIREQGNAREWKQIERDLNLVRETGCRYHVCHISARESLDLIRAAKRDGLPVTCETAPHYLTLTAADRAHDPDGRFHMNAPLRDEADRSALVEGFADGSIDILATDHAPHTRADKRGGAMGIVGLETAFPVVYTSLVRTGQVTLERLIDAMSIRPREVFRLGDPESCVGEPCTLALIDPQRQFTIRADAFASMGRNTPYDGWNVWGSVVRLGG